jgi:hypothetical protein
VEQSSVSETRSIVPPPVPLPASCPLFVHPLGAAAPVLPSVVRRMVSLFDGGRSVEEVCAEAGVPLTQGQAVVLKLRRLGLLHLPGLPELGPCELEEPLTFDEFSVTEEAFFATELPPIDECDLPREGWWVRLRRWLRGSAR